MNGHATIVQRAEIQIDGGGGFCKVENGKLVYVNRSPTNLGQASEEAFKESLQNGVALLD